MNSTIGTVNPILSIACHHENADAFQGNVGIVPLQFRIDCPYTAKPRSQIALIDAIEPVKTIIKQKFHKSY